MDMSRKEPPTQTLSLEGPASHLTIGWHLEIVFRNFQADKKSWLCVPKVFMETMQKGMNQKFPKM